MTRQLKLAAIVAALAALALAAGPANGAERGIDLAKTAKYKGGTINSNTAADQGLACLEDAAGGLSCFDSAEELAASAAASREAARAAGSNTATTARKRVRRKAVASADCGVPPDAMAITQHQDFNWNVVGWVIAGYARQNWYNMTGSYANSASSVSAGNHSGYLANEPNGGSTRLRLEVNQCERYLSWVYFNDRAESRYRN